MESAIRYRRIPASLSIVADSKATRRRTRSHRDPNQCRSMRKVNLMQLWPGYKMEEYEEAYHRQCDRSGCLGWRSIGCNAFRSGTATGCRVPAWTRYARRYEFRRDPGEHPEYDMRAWIHGYDSAGRELYQSTEAPANDGSQ